MLWSVDACHHRKSHPDFENDSVFSIFLFLKDEEKCYIIINVTYLSPDEAEGIVGQMDRFPPQKGNRNPKVKR